MICIGLFIYLVFCCRNNSETKYKETIKCHAVGIQCDCETSMTSLNQIQSPQGCEQLEYQMQSNAVGTHYDCGTSINPVQSPHVCELGSEALRKHRDALLQSVVGNLMNGSRSQAQVVCKQSQESPPRIQNAEDAGQERLTNISKRPTVFSSML